jgi:hypothetical protein
MGESKRDLPRPTPILGDQVDLSLLRYMLGLSPIERLKVLKGGEWLQRIAEVLAKHQVEHIVIGGTAAVLWGAAVPAADVELCYRRSAENLVRLAAALAEVRASPLSAPPDFPFRLDPKSLALGSRFSLATDAGPLELHLFVDPAGDHDQLLPRTASMDLGSIHLRVIGLEDLLRTLIPQVHPRDLEARRQLSAIHRILAERGSKEAQQ